MFRTDQEAMRTSCRSPAESLLFCSPTLFEFFVNLFIPLVGHPSSVLLMHPFRHAFDQRLSPTHAGFSLVLAALWPFLVFSHHSAAALLVFL